MNHTEVLSNSGKRHEPRAESSVLCLAVVPRSGFVSGPKPLEFPLYWIETDPATADLSRLNEVLKEVLVDPLLEELWCVLPDERSGWITQWREQGFKFWAERQYLPGVTDNLGKTVEEALQLSGLPDTVRVASGTGLLIAVGTIGTETGDVERYCRYRHYHPVTDRFVTHDLKEAKQHFLGFPAVHLPEPSPVQVVSLDLNDTTLMSLSRQRILALNLAEMKAIRKYYEQGKVKKKRQDHGLPEWPTDVELEIIAQTWSEHCKHKIFNATIKHQDNSKPKPKKTVIKSLYKTYIQAATKELMPKRPDLLSVFSDNAGVVRWNEDWAVCFKVETHNSPSALEPYGGAITGILGVNRDILGTGIGAKPIFNTDIFCFAYPEKTLPQRPTMLPAESIIQGVRKGVQDGGNKSGIPTVNGAVYFHPGYRAKPLVFCGTGGVLPIKVKGKSGYEKHTQPGDIIVMAGGRVGKDGIHGATFSSEALHEGSPVSAVQIGDPFTQKRLLDFIIEARDAGLITGITDNGAGGLSSSVGEMATITGGAKMELDNIPLKYPGLADYEIVVSESQERMTISTRYFPELLKLANKHRVEITNIGTFNTNGYFEVTRHGKPVAMLDLEFLHDGAPHMVLESQWKPGEIRGGPDGSPTDLNYALLKLLASPNICSREEVIRQYDHEVQGSSVVKPLMGPLQQAPCDAAVIKPLLEGKEGLVVSNGLCPQLSEYDAYLMGVCAVDEAVRNAVCVGSDPQTLTLLDNFCWCDPIASERNLDGRNKLGQLVVACQGLYDAVKAFAAPLISGKDSMKNDFDDGVVRISVPPTLLVSAMGKIHDVDQAVTMEFKKAGDLIYLLSAGNLGLAATEYGSLRGWNCGPLPGLDLTAAANLYRQLHMSIMKSWVKSAHDLSEGGLAVAVSECVIGSQLGAELMLNEVMESARPAAMQSTQLSGIKTSGSKKSNTKVEGTDLQDKEIYDRTDFALFAEGPGRIIVTVDPGIKSQWEKFWEGFRFVQLGTVTSERQLCLTDANHEKVLNIAAGDLAKAWKTSLPFDENWTVQ